jgi:hypothetical protein
MSTAQWANIGDDAGALHALLERVPEQVAVEVIDYVWIFPPRRIAVGESTVVVVGAFDEDPQRRRVITAHYTVARNRKGVADVKARFDEHGSAPEAAVPRIVQGVLRRLGEDAEAEPRSEQIGGDGARWAGLLVELGGRPAPADAPAAPAPAGAGSDPAGEDAATTEVAEAAEVPEVAEVHHHARVDTAVEPADRSGASPHGTSHGTPD